MSTSDEMISQLNDKFNGLEDKVVECGDKYNAAVQHIMNWQFMLGPAMFLIKPAMDEIREHLAKVGQLVQTAVTHHAPVVSLIVQSFNWVAKIQAPVNGLAHQKTDLAYQWEGKAAAKYQDKVTAQNDAIKAYSAKSDNVSKWLMEIAQYNVEYMTKLAEVVTSFLGQLVTVAIETATVIEIPFAVDKLAGAIGQLATDMMNNLVGVAERFVAALSKVRELMSLMTDTALPDRAWPQAVEG
ncbi:hypothetical protein [Amycolatopsis magusensis]|uniref:Uncharacterized protein YukE n=1 Tax=Amycolatopsis magusensis TaxID=882444 RepID=A0ABS4PWD2_9PSEU|nr:hypothetical protein [Amycolatopsis magusensis]MBP2183720.1 uncharacterized protein YukE [Amycolatopsis magusensis]